MLAEWSSDSVIQILLSFGYKYIVALAVENNCYAKCWVMVKLSQDSQ